jgi:hypothetical protein
MLSNDYVSIKFEPERGLVVHLVVGIHVADVAVADQVHVSYVSYLFLTLTNMTEVASLHVASRASKYYKSELILTSSFLSVQNWCQIASS